MKYKVWVKTSTFGISREIIEADQVSLENGDLIFANETSDTLRASRARIETDKKIQLEIVALIAKGHWFYLRKWKP